MEEYTSHLGGKEVCHILGASDFTKKEMCSSENALCLPATRAA